jgi:ABC-type thiamine transport system ATPase subunit
MENKIAKHLLKLKTTRWVEFIDVFIQHYNHTRYSSTNQTPFSVIFGENNLYYALSRENLEGIIPNTLLNNRERVLNIQRIQASVCL